MKYLYKCNVYDERNYVSYLNYNLHKLVDIIIKKRILNTKNRIAFLKIESFFDEVDQESYGETEDITNYVLNNLIPNSVFK